MRITKYVHSCLLVEKDSSRILFDPGLFSFVEGAVKPSQFENLQAIILTHCHPDHIDDESLKKIIENNPRAGVFANAEIVGKLAKKDIAAEVYETGKRTIGGFAFEAFDAPHENLLADEIPQNTAYTLDGKLLHPGDSLSGNLYNLKNISILALPIMAPWATELQVYDFAKKIAPQNVIPIHDGYAKDFFLKSRYQNFQKYFEKEIIKFQWMNEPGDYFETEK